MRIIRGFAGFLFWLGLVLLVLAMAAPARIIREKIYLTHGVDVMIVLDQSPSMAAQDFTPVNRFEAAREVVANFVQTRENDAVGLVGFGTEAALRVPPTLDYHRFGQQLGELELLEMGTGTSIGMGIAVASLHLRESSAQQKIIVLITDGESNSGEITAEAAGDIARQMGIRIYTIGIGTDGEVPLTYVDPETGVTYSGTYSSNYNEALLRGLSDTTGGKHFSAASRGTLESIFRTIDSLETVEKRVRTHIITIPVHRELILVGLVLILVDFMIRRLILREVLP